MNKADRLAKGIYWDRSWSAFTGCSPVGAGCDNCWAKRTANRLRGRFGYPVDDPFRPTFHPGRLDQVNSRQKPQVIALCFMSDPFHVEHSGLEVHRMLEKICECPQHTFIALTKRPELMRGYLRYYADVRGNSNLPNLIGGGSVWDQESADRMVPILLETNLATRIVSLEPCLGAVDLKQATHIDFVDRQRNLGISYTKAVRLDGVILGGESGPGARPMRLDWARSVRDQCRAAGVPFFFKQWGEWLHESQYGTEGIRITSVLRAKEYAWPDGTFSYRVGKKAAGRLLDGQEWNQLPEIMQ